MYVQTRFAERMEALTPGSHYVTVIFTDIRGFSKRVERETQRMGVSAAAILKEKHDQLIRKHLGVGDYVKSLGDGCLFIFQDVCAPLQPLVELQKAFRQSDWNQAVDNRLEIRIGVHSGDVYVTNDDPQTKFKDVLSDAVNLTSRVMETAPAGTIHLTDEVYRHCSSLSGINLWSVGTVNDLGFLEMRGRLQRCHIWQINPFGPRLPPDLSKQGLPSHGKAAWQDVAPLVVAGGLWLANTLLQKKRQGEPVTTKDSAAVDDGKRLDSND